ncbi:hypothetical protein SNK03_000352 [Fusarium graminearum]
MTILLSATLNLVFFSRHIHVFLLTWEPTFVILVLFLSLSLSLCVPCINSLPLFNFIFFARLVLSSSAHFHFFSWPSISLPSSACSALLSAVSAYLYLVAGPFSPAF